METTQLTDLEKIVTNSGLELSESEEIMQSYLPFFTKLAEIKNHAKKINFENPSEIDEEIARDLRRMTVKVRTGSETVKDNRKRKYILRGNVEQDSWNLLKSGCLLEEQIFLEVEKKREIQAAKEREELKQTRLKELEPYNDIISTKLIDLGNMDTDRYLSLLNTAKISLQAKIDQEAKEEQERMEAERKEIEERERIKAENEKLRQLNEAKEKELTEQREKAELERKKQQAILDGERKKQDEILEQQRKKLAKEKADKEKANSELKALKESETKRIADEKAKVEAEAKDKELAERKQKSAPDREKLSKMILDLKLVEPILNKESSFVVLRTIQKNLELFKTSCYEQISEL